MSPEIAAWSRPRLTISTGTASNDRRDCAIHDRPAGVIEDGRRRHEQHVLNLADRHPGGSAHAGAHTFVRIGDRQRQVELLGRRPAGSKVDARQQRNIADGRAIVAIGDGVEPDGGGLSCGQLAAVGLVNARRQIDARQIRQLEDDGSRKCTVSGPVFLGHTPGTRRAIVGKDVHRTIRGSRDVQRRHLPLRPLQFCANFLDRPLAGLAVSSGVCFGGGQGRLRLDLSLLGIRQCKPRLLGLDFRNESNFAERQPRTRDVELGLRHGRLAFLERDARLRED